MKTAIITLIALLCISTVTVANTSERYTLRDSQGRLSGSVVINGNRAVIRSSQGRMSASVVQSGSRVTVRDSSGRIVGSATRSGR